MIQMYIIWIIKYLQFHIVIYNYETLIHMHIFVVIKYFEFQN